MQYTHNTTPTGKSHVVTLSGMCTALPMAKPGLNNSVRHEASEYQPNQGAATAYQKKSRLGVGARTTMPSVAPAVRVMTVPEMGTYPASSLEKLAPDAFERPFSAGQILRLSALTALLGLSRSTIYDRMDPRSPRYDPAFPKQFKLGRSAVGWSATEVLAWIKEQAGMRGT